MRTRQGKRNVLALAALWAICVPGFGPAQTITGEITGTVTDQSGGIVPGATLELIREGIGAARTGTTNQSGSFVFAALPPGTYTLKVYSAGFRNFEQSGIVPNQTLAVASSREDRRIHVIYVGDTRLNDGGFGNSLRGSMTLRLPVGEYEATVLPSGATEWTQPTRVRADREQLHLQLPEFRGDCAVLLRARQPR